MLSLNHLPKALRWLRLASGLKQCDVANSAGVSASMLSGYEKGTRTPSLESLVRILSALDTGLAELEEVMNGFAREKDSEDEAQAWLPGVKPPEKKSWRPPVSADPNAPYALPGTLVPTSMLADTTGSILSPANLRALRAAEAGSSREALDLLRQIQSLLAQNRAYGRSRNGVPSQVEELR